MKTRLNSNTSGFTLIEIIIVVIIVGILASLAVPKFAAQIENAKAGEAFNMIGAFNRSFDRCYALEGKIASCDAWETELDMVEPKSDKFTYKIDTAPTGATKCNNAKYTIALEAKSEKNPADLIYGCVDPTGTTKPAIIGKGNFANIVSKVDEK